MESPHQDKHECNHAGNLGPARVLPSPWGMAEMVRLYLSTQPVPLAFHPGDERIERVGEHLCIRPLGSGRDVERMICPVDWYQRRYLPEPRDGRSKQPRVGQCISGSLQEEHRNADVG